MKYLIDTTWIISYFRGEEKVISKLLSLREEGLAVSIVSIAELYEGVFRSTDPARNEESLRDFLTQVTVLEVNAEICKVFGRERAKLHKTGKPIGDLDLFIASTCLHHGLAILTSDENFEKVENLKVFKE